MQKRLWGVSAAALALTCLTVTGCGTAQHATPSTDAPETTQTTSHQPINVKNNLKNQPVFTLYKNPLFGFEVLYPASWIMGTSPQDGDGRAS
ncbi:MAG: hypothetical protein OWR62_09470, partial [Sulfobacillus thermotolerans]|nr:hypothetical protein [Sulfobacillus thermotolerans]